LKQTKASSNFELKIISLSHLIDFVSLKQPKKVLLIVLLIVSSMFNTFAVLANTVNTANKGRDINAFADINFAWRFSKNEDITAKDTVYSQLFDDSAWQLVNLPHDWSIENIGSSNSPFDKNSVDQYDTGYSQGGIGWYRKTIKLSKSLKDKIAILEFGGIYMNSEVYINGHYVGGQHYGYTSFWLDITQQLNFGEDNTIVVKVNNNHLNSRWYSGSGIYRPVSLRFKAAVHIERWGTSISTPSITKHTATVKVATVVVNRLSANSSADSSAGSNDVRQISKAKVFLLSQILNNKNDVITEVKSPVEFAQVKTVINTQLIVANPRLWSPKTPQLYTLRQTLVVEGKNQDINETVFGIRQLTFDAKKGFLINGQSMLLQGLNIHHDNYLLGSAAHKRAEERKVEKILSAGYNAVRTAHNPPSTYFLNAADRLGLLVINEAFDAWNKQKWDHKNDYASRFKQDWQTDLSNFINRDKNHASIIMWSVGNEIPEQNDQQGADTAAMLKAFVLSIDDSREITIGANTSGEKSDPFLKNFNVVGYNYQEMNYQSDHQRFQQRIMYGSETYSDKAFDYWQYVENHPYIIGDFVWTGWDYLGEASIGWTGYAPEWKGLAPFPWTLAYCGEMDALGYKRPSAYYRDVLWKTGQNKISVFVKSSVPSLQGEKNHDGFLDWVQPDLHPSWTWPQAKGKSLEVVVYSVFDEVELFINGKSLGRKATSAATEFKTQYLVPYEEGQLKAVGYLNGRSDGHLTDKIMGEWILNTASKPSQIRLTQQRKTMLSDGADLVYITAELFDKNGLRVYYWHDDLVVNFNVSGPGELLALGNANPRSVESFTGMSRTTFRGRVVAVIQSRHNESGEITITASAAGLKQATTSVSSKKP